MRDRIEELTDDPEALERLYREVKDRGQSTAFRHAVAECLERRPESLLLRAWAARLGHLPGTAAESAGLATAVSPRQRWQVAIGTSIVCGALFALMAGGHVPVPIPWVAASLFWIGWSPVTAIALLAFLGIAAPDAKRRGWLVGAGGAAVIAGLLGALGGWGRTDDTAGLVALHLPFVAWAAVAAGVTLGRAERARHGYAYIVQSMETLVAAGVFVGAGMMFGGLTAGIFAVVGVQIPEYLLRVAAAFGIGVVPAVAVATVYNPAVAPAEQTGTSGVGRVLRIMAWLLMPPVLAVLTVYVLWFIPAYFWRPFAEREILIVYNATIIAVLALVAAAASGTGLPAGWTPPRALRPATLAITGLTLLLNLYALAAIATRTAQQGLTPNRHAVLGWNVVTLIMLAFVLARTWRADDEWLGVCRASLAGSMPLAVGWAAWVAWVIPLLHRA